ncbi:hypothetical protein F4818DRAFT_457480, partial [Hypoxylon cercidicola]
TNNLSIFSTCNPILEQNHQLATLPKNIVTFLSPFRAVRDKTCKMSNIEDEIEPDGHHGGGLRVVSNYVPMIKDQFMDQVIAMLNALNLAPQPRSRLVTDEEYRVTRQALHGIFQQRHQAILNQIQAGMPFAIDLVPIVVVNFLRQATEIALGLHPVLKFSWETKGSSGRSGVSRLLRRQPSLGTTGVSSFPSFVKLPPEIKVMVWDFVIWDENRVVNTTKFQKITRAPCPVLFLVSKAIKEWVKPRYRKLEAGANGADMLMSNVIPVDDARRGPVLSFENDIYEMGDWDQWQLAERTKVLVHQRLKTYQPLRKKYQQILALRERRIRRVAFHANALDDNYVRTRKPELMFYRDALNKEKTIWKGTPQEKVEKVE